MKEILAVLAQGGIVVAANNRLARSLILACNQRERDAGRRAWPTPAVLTWHAFVDRLWARSAARGGAAGAQPILADHQSRLVWRAVVDAESASLLPGASGSVADLAADAWRLAQDWCIGPAELVAAADSEDSRRFAAWAAGYRQRCENAGFVDPAAVVGLLCGDLRTGAIEPPGQLHLAGFADRTPLQEDLLRSLAACGCVISEDSAGPTGPHDISHYRCPDARAELEQAARWARGLREQEPLARIAIVVPKLSRRINDVRRTVLDIFSPGWRLEPELPIGANFSYGQPLAGVGLVRSALVVLGVITGRVDYRRAGELLATRYLPGHGSEASARARCDFDLRDRIGTEMSLAELVAGTRKLAPVFSGRFAALAGFAAKLPRRQQAGEWAAAFRKVLEAVGWPGDAALASDEFQAATAWQDLLDELRSCDPVSGPMDCAAALAVLESLARTKLFQPAGDPAAIQILGVMEAVGQRFDALWVCGMESGAWPAATRSNPLLPLQLQRERHLPGSSPALAREHAEKLLRWLEARATRIIFSSPEFAGDEPLAASPLLAHLPVTTAVAPAWDGLCWVDGMREQAVLERLEPDPPPALPGGRRLRGGTVLLEREARCPARAFIEFRLGASELPVPVPGIDATKRGSITHEVLQRFFSVIDQHAALVALTPGEETRLLEEAIDDTLARFATAADPLLRRIATHERERQHNLVAGFLALEKQRDDFRILGIEVTPEQLRLPPALAALQLHFRIDRIDEMPGGHRLVIDYKTGKQLPAKRSYWESPLRSPQLPFYALLTDADGIAFAQLATGMIGWQGVACTDSWMQGIVTAEQLTNGQIPQWGDLRAFWWTALDDLAKDVLAGRFVVNRWQLDLAQGEWAMAIRAFELGEDADEDEPA